MLKKYPGEHFGKGTNWHTKAEASQEESEASYKPAVMINSSGSRCPYMARLPIRLTVLYVHCVWFLDPVHIPRVCFSGAFDFRFEGWLRPPIALIKKYL